MYTFKMCYPGIYDEKEQKAFDELDAISRSFAERGPIDPANLVSGGYPAGTPGIQEPAVISQDILSYYNEKYLPDEPLYHDKTYAQALGYKSVPALITIAAYEHMLQIPVPPFARDEFIASNLWRKVTSVKPMYAGDTIWFTVDYLNWKDITPANGSIYRTISIACGGSMYNQKGELVSRMDMKWYENLRTYEGEKPEIKMPFVMVDWQTRPEHIYTDDDWQRMHDIWKNEYRRGSDILYWDDVSIGDTPSWTLDGPFDDTPNPAEPWGPGAGGSRSLRKEYMDEATFKTMIRNPHDGIYRLSKRSLSYPELPQELIANFSIGGGFGDLSFTADDDPRCPSGPRAIFINFFGRDVALRHIQNWMGDHGILRDISWGIMNCACFRSVGYDFPEDPDIPDFLSVVPEMKDAIPTHGLERDVMLIKSRVFDKCIVDGEYQVKLAWWIETIDGQLYESGHATVVLPKR